jgi:PAS domain S-box-containing protein
MGHFMWPRQGLPIAAAVIGYCFVRSVFADIIVPLCTKQPVNRSWPESNLRGCPNYCIGASLAVGLAEAMDHQNWQVLLVAAVPLYFAYRAYCAHVNRLEEEHRRREVIGSLDQGMSVIDSSGLITLWNDALEGILGCPRQRALGRSLASAVPALGGTELPRAINDALTNRSPRTLARLGLPAPAGARVLQVKILPVVGGVTLLWHDVTERTRA